ncbi:MAG: uncharacterized protein QOD99_2276 [Chthoniobacter sp.]|jgi:predicted aldo/keto reductase-like oxidoreductase|nr:uncharacterized protein [Chthoniobacter sp.]
MHRRSFLKLLGGATAGVLVANARGAENSDKLGELLPRRKLGKTGATVTMLGLGGWHVGAMNERDAQETIEKAIAGGVRFFDTAESYHGGGSEQRLGKLLVPKYREHIFLMTKTTAHDAATARKHLDGSLQRLGTDHLDLWQMHSVHEPGDVDHRLEAGVLDVLLEAKAAGKVRFIGFTGHLLPEGHLRVLEKADAFETCQMPINVLDPSYHSFVKNVLPRLVERDMGVLAMKTLANGGFFRGSSPLVPNRISMREAIHFVWSLPVSVLISGPDNPAQFAEKIELARSFANLDEKAREALIVKVADLAGRGVENYKA